MCMFDEGEYWACAAAELEQDRQDAEADAKNGCWTRKDGSKIRVSEMSTDYIKNCIAYINRTDTYDVMLSLLVMLTEELERRNGQRR